ncbi:Protein of unknown function DUF4192 [Candidatus Nanopelagicaceae bacterium]
MPTLTSAHDLITAVPFLIGFHPTESIVLISIKDGAIGLAMRINLPDQLDSDAIDLLAHNVIKEESDAVLLVAYMPADREDGDSLLISLGAALIRSGLSIQESIVVRDGRYRSIICRDLECCPELGITVPAIEESQIAAEHVVAGNPMPYAHISELIETLAADPASFDFDWSDEVANFFIAEDAEEIGALRRDGVETMELLLDEYRIGRGPTNRILLARMIGRMSDVQVRDYALGVHSEDTYDLYFTMWRELLRLAPRGFVAPIACIVAAMAYESGDGALAQKALDRAFDDNQHYPLASLLRRVFNAGWPPESFASMRAELHPKVIAAIYE